MESSNSDLMSDLVITEINEEETIEMSGNKGEYFISEPFDYIFEPGHYPQQKNSRKSKIFKHAKIIRDRDGILEYEYESYTYNKDMDSNMNPEELDSFYLDSFDSETHLHGLMRSITLPKWPGVGFGFSLSKSKCDNQDMLFVSEVFAESPAESCLQIGDLVLELDDLNLKNCDTFFNLEKYMENKDNVNLVVIHKTKYPRLKLENELKNVEYDCENFVICNLRNK
ncbi:hypothetical protein BpHYR1_033976 [Brachionus plicatilis]|uniref:PDZ domain-containing protein n=1 Tax=Brachionus plicatilis TaxID=10195 RepID=A0A3M7R4C2_BRAPC|nr:hypothetical protein BpHYR1_033976 [Brachionus plicatilis]